MYNMKGLIYGLTLLGAFSMVSCDETARLAKELPGSWAGTPENFTDNASVTATIIESIDISSNPDMMPKGVHGGTLTIAGMLSANTQIVGQPGFVEPLGLTVSGRSTISGTWTVIDDDEVAVSLDPSTLTVSVDPDAVVVNGVITEMNGPRVDSIKPSVASAIWQSLKMALVNRYSAIRKLDDVKIKGPLMKFEIGDTDYVFTRQSAAQ